MLKKFHLFNDTHMAAAGYYEIVRLFDKDRVLVELSSPFSRPRQLTILRLDEGEIV
jgi:hypothetical protein